MAGYSEQIRFLEEVVLWPIQHISYLSYVGVSHLTGLLITGPSGVGKTLIARSLAKESGFNVIEIRGPELISKYMGESERNIRELFRRAREMSPAVVLLDGIDAMAASGWSDSKVIDRIVNQLVMEMNAISKEKPILVVAICNRAEDLPPQLTATGRFGTELALALPDSGDREALFGMYLSGASVLFEGDLHRAALEAEGLSCGDIEEICRRVMLHAARVALEKHDPPPDRITIPEADLLKTLDRWKLSA
jgi:transitional endoplasmic reticulum ATPase